MDNLLGSPGLGVQWEGSKSQKFKKSKNKILQEPLFENGDGFTEQKRLEELEKEKEKGRGKTLGRIT